MKSTTVDAEGNVVCPVCGAKNSFTSKRTGKAKIGGVVTLGVGVVAMPKRLKCNGCGTYLKRGTAQTSQVSAPPMRLSAEKVLHDDGMRMSEIRRLRDQGVDLDEVIRERGLDPR